MPAINVPEVLRCVQDFEKFCSVAELHALVETLRADPARFKVTVAGTSTNGLPIHHVQFGRGSVKALVVAFPHCNEPTGGLTVFSLLTLLRQGHPALTQADVEWHIVPCIDPDGAILNEGWSQKPVTLASYLRNVHRQELRDQVECSFPIHHKRLVFDQPTREARILQTLLDEIRPDFYYSLHNNPGTGGAWFLLNHPVDRKYYQQLHTLLEQHDIELRRNLPYAEFCKQHAPGIKEPTTLKNYYDFLERTLPDPAKVLNTGACSWEYLADIKPTAVTFVAELPYLRHPSDGSQRQTTEHLRQLKLRADADNKFIATLIFAAWDDVKDDLDAASPFYRKIYNGMIGARDTLQEGLPTFFYKTREVLFAPEYGRIATEGERFNVHLIDRFIVLCNSHEFIRLLRTSPQTPRIRQAIERLEPVFDSALQEICQQVDAEKFEVIDCGMLARVQLGSGLIVLNSLLEASCSASRTNVIH